MNTQLCWLRRGKLTQEQEDVADTVDMAEEAAVLHCIGRDLRETTGDFSGD
jgi:hypothetical protein